MDKSLVSYACICHLLLHVFCTFFCQYMCIMFFLLWAASYDGLMSPLAACHCNSDVYYLCYVLGK